MNGVHDMGGMHGMGPVQLEKDEPVFHARVGRARLRAERAMRAWRKWNIDAGRHALELMPAADYLRMSYYERWFARLEAHVVQIGLVTRDEIEQRQAGAPAPRRSRRRFTLATSAALAEPRHRVEPRARRRGRAFKVGQRVRARNINPDRPHAPAPLRARQGRASSTATTASTSSPTRTRTPGEKPQHVYSVRFAARELWGEQASPRDSSTSTCGTTTSSAPDLAQLRRRLAALPRCRATRAARSSPSRGRRRRSRSR